MYMTSMVKMDKLDTVCIFLLVRLRTQTPVFKKFQKLGTAPVQNNKLSNRRTVRLKQHIPD